MYEFGETRIAIEEIKPEKGSIKVPNGFYLAGCLLDSKSIPGGMSEESKKWLNEIENRYFIFKIPEVFKDPLTQTNYSYRPDKDDIANAVIERLSRVDIYPNADDPNGKPHILLSEPKGVAAFMQWQFITMPNHFVTPDHKVETGENIAISDHLTELSARVHKERITPVIAQKGVVVQNGEKFWQVFRPIRLNIASFGPGYLTTEQLPDGSIMHISVSEINKLTIF